MAKQFTIVRYPKNEALYTLNGTNNQIYHDYNIAFDVFNTIVSEENKNQFHQPKGERPMRAELKDDVIELWVVDYAPAPILA